MRRRRGISVFGLSFLDVMFCGFGSVILLVMIVNADTLEKREEITRDLRGEVTRIEREILEGERFMVELRNSMEVTEEELVVTEGLSRRVIADKQRIETGLADLDRQTLARKEDVRQLKSDLKKLDVEQKRLAAKIDEGPKEGAKVRQFLGQGDRQYLTGLKLGGRRILMLVDASASMLDETIVNIIRRRNMSEAARRNSPKWLRALATVEWLVSQLPPASRFQIYTFNTEAKAVIAGSEGRWLEAADSKILDQAVGKLRNVVPAGGTSLYRAFASIRGMSQRPDNVILLTDGLPTQAGKPRAGKVSGDQRLRYFNDALRQLPGRTPVNVILFPIEGDPFAASAFWKLAMSTKGSFMSPSGDWP